MNNFQKTFEWLLKNITDGKHRPWAAPKDSHLGNPTSENLCYFRLLLPLLKDRF